MTRTHRSKAIYGLYPIRLRRWQVPAYWSGRAIDWAVDQLAAFHCWREANKTWRRLASPYHRVTTRIDDRRPVPDTVEGMNQRGVIDARKLGV